MAPTDASPASGVRHLSDVRLSKRIVSDHLPGWVATAALATDSSDPPSLRELKFCWHCIECVSI
jgi:hypothetical protein